MQYNHLTAPIHSKTELYESETKDTDIPKLRIFLSGYLYVIQSVLILKVNVKSGGMFR